MTRGIERARAQQQAEAGWDGEDIVANPPEAVANQDMIVEEDEAPPPPSSTGSRIFGGFLILLALGWIAASALAFSRTGAQPSLLAVLSWIATVSVPLVLLGIAWLAFGNTSRREAERFTRAVAAMRAESRSLESVLAIVAERIEENQSRIGEAAGRLMSLGDEASDRLGRVTHYISRETAELGRKSQALENAAANARVDIGVLLSDLPRAEEQTRILAEALKQAGISAQQQAGSLENQLSSLTVKGREADEIVGGAAQRLAASLTRIETGADAAARRIDEAAAQMNMAVDSVMVRASESMDQTRSGLAAQSEAILAIVEQGKAAYEQAGSEAGRDIAERVDRITRKIETVAERLAEQEETTGTLVNRLTGQIGELEERLISAGHTGGETHDRLQKTLEAVRASIADLKAEMNAGQSHSGDLIARSQEMADALGTVTNRIREELPQSLSDAEAHISRTIETARSAIPAIQAIHIAAAQAAGTVAESDASVTRQRQSLDALTAAVNASVGEAEEKLRALRDMMGQADQAAAHMARETGPELIGALARVREAANQAAIHARDAISAAIPEGAAALAEASRKAVGEAVAGSVRDQIAELGAVSGHAAQAAQEASERLTRQLLTIGDTAAAVENRIAGERAAREEKDAETMARRVSLLIESLNSTAIDLNKILSNEIPDKAWAAYLKGERGIFARRAVRLLSSGEAREIARHYREEPEFREHVTRYIGDFETMLRRVLADKEGAPIGVALLSSDMGKLYAALSQAVERLRR